jgi:serine/threonine protein kinase
MRLAPVLQETEAFMIMDLCDGTLDSILQAASGTLPDRAILKIFGDVCSGVLHMHSQRPPIAHR